MQLAGGGDFTLASIRLLLSGLPGHLPLKLAFFWTPPGLYKFQNSPDLIVTQLLVISGHRALRKVAAINYKVNQQIVGMMPGMTAIIVRRCG